MNKKNIKILILQNNKFQSLLLERELSKNFVSVVVSIARNVEEFNKFIVFKSFNFIIADCESIENDNPDCVKRICEKAADCSIIYLTDNSSEQHLKDLRKAGIQKILVKNESAYMAVPGLIREIISSRLIENRQNPKANFLNRNESDMVNITVGTLSHEINNPLMTILGMTELILEGEMRYDREVIKKVRIIQKSAKRIESTLQKLRTINHPLVKNTDSGEIIDTSSTFNLVK